MNETKIIIMAKTPVAGMAKTRLIPSIGMENSGRLAKMLFRHTINEAISSDIGPIEFIKKQMKSNRIPISRGQLLCVGVRMWHIAGRNA